MNAKLLTSQFIDYLFTTKDLSNGFLAMETLYSKNSRRADLVYVNDFCTAYEIKGELDNLKKLEEQISDYKKCFNEVYLVTVPKHLPTARKILSRDVGIILYSEEEFKIIRQAIHRIRIDKKEVLSSISINFLRKELKYKNNCAYGFREQVTSFLSINKIMYLWTDWLKQSYSDNFSLFKRERGSFTCFEDLKTISSKSSHLKVR